MDEPSAHVAALLERTLLDDTAHVQVATRQLLAFERVPGYGAVLLTIVASARPPAVRQAAVAACKNLVERQWSTLADDERRALRARVAELAVTLADAVLHRQLADIVVLFVRRDYPAAWSTAFEHLTAAAQQVPRLLPLQLLRDTVRAIMRAPNYYRFDGDARRRRALEQRGHFYSHDAARVFTEAAPYWMRTHTQLLEHLAQFSQTGASSQLAAAAVQAMARECRACLQILRSFMGRLMAQFERENGDGLYAYFEQAVRLLSASLDCYRALRAQTHPLEWFVSTSVVLLAKQLADAQEHCPLTFVPLLERTLRLCEDLLFQPPAPPLLADDEKILIIALNVLANVLTVRQYRYELAELARSRLPSNEPLDAARVGRAHAILQAYASPTHLLKLAQLLVSRYLQLTLAQWELWEDDPEALVDEEFADAYETRVQPCAEYLFHRILAFDSDASAVIANALLATLERSPPPATFETACLVDALLLALALCGNAVLKDSLQFEDIFEKVLRTALRTEGHFAPIIRRRVVHVLQYWSRSIPRRLQKECFTMCLDCLRDKDLVVRIYAAAAMRSLLDDLDLSAGEMIEFIQPSVNAIVALANEVNSPTTTTHVLALVADTVKTVGEQARPHLDQIVAAMALLWQQGVETRRHSVLTAVIRVLAALVEELVGAAAELERNLLPVLQTCFAPSTSFRNEVIVDAMELWLPMVQQSAFISPPLAQVFAISPAIIRAHRDDVYVLRDMVRVASAYVLCGKAMFVQTNAEALNAILKDMMLFMVRGKDLAEAAELLGLLLQLCPQHVHHFAEALRHAVVTLNRRHHDNNHDVAFYALCELMCRFLLHARNAYLAFFCSLGGDGSAGDDLFMGWVTLLTAEVKPANVPYTSSIRVFIAAAAFLIASTTPASPHASLLPALIDFAASLYSTLIARRRLGKYDRRRYKRVPPILSASPCARNLKEAARKDSTRMNDSSLRCLLVQSVSSALATFDASSQNQVQQMLTASTKDVLREAEEHLSFS